MNLDGVAALLKRGRADGYHLGAQLEARRPGESPVSIAIGEAREGVAMTGKTLLPWFSCTKAVTAVAVAQQWERGGFRLDDPVARHLPEFTQEGKGAVTIRHLLTHTAGLRGALPADQARSAAWDATTRRICASPMDADWVPGERAAYHPVSTFHLLGELVQRCDGRPFAAYVSEEIFEPLDMGDSWVALPPERHAGYGDRIGLMHDTSTRDEPPRPLARLAGPEGFSAPMPAGSGIGPMSDLVKLFEMFVGLGARGGERILQETTVEAMAARHRAGMTDETFGMVIDWGLGLMVNSWHYRGRPTSYGYGEHASRRAFGHGGSQSSLAFADPVSGLAVALCCNGMPGEPANHRRTQPVVTALYEALGLVS